MSEKEEQVVFKKEDYFHKTDAEYGNEISWVIPNAQKNMMEPILLTLEPGGSTYPDNPHEGEEFGYVLSGSVKVHIGNRIFSAKVGESFYYASHKKHYIEADKKGAKVLWVSTPPTF